MLAGPDRDSDPARNHASLDRRKLWASTRPGGYGSIMLESMIAEALLPGDDRAKRSLAVLRAVADPIRWEVLELLATRCRCVCDLQEEIAVAPNLLSYHLKVLRDVGLVTTARRGRWIDYSLAVDAGEQMRAALPGAAGGRVDVAEPVPAGVCGSGA